MKEKIPLRVYFRVAILLFFTSIMIWYFSFRVLCMIAPNPAYIIELWYVSLFFSIVVCLSLVKRGIRDEMKNKDQSFSLVARDPNVEIRKEKITRKKVIHRIVASIFISFILTLPVTTIGALQVLNRKLRIMEILDLFIAGYWKLYLGCFLAILFLSFFQRYLLDRWQWTKAQF